MGRLEATFLLVRQGRGENEVRKFANRAPSGQAFPCPREPLKESIVLVEGGIKSFSSALIRHYLKDSAVKEITIFFDNDEAGKAAQGGLAEKLRANGFKGRILLARAEKLEEFKDIDEALLFGHADFVRDAIQQAVEYGAPQKPDPEDTPKPAHKEPEDTPKLAHDERKAPPGKLPYQVENLYAREHVPAAGIDHDTHFLSVLDAFHLPPHFRLADTPERAYVVIDKNIPYDSVL